MARVKSEADLRKAKGQFIGFRLLESLLSLLPASSVYRFGGLVGRFCYHLFKKKRRLVEKNLAIAFPELAMQKNATKKVFQQVGANLLSSLKTSSIPTYRLQDHYHWVKNEAYKEAVRADAPRMVILGHVSNWELLSRAVGVDMQKSGALYRPLDNPYIDDVIKQRRESDGMQLFSKRKGLAQAIRSLKNNGLLGILADQYVHQASAKVTIFDKQTQISRMPQMIYEKIASGQSEGSEIKVFYLSLKSTSPGYWQLELQKKPVNEPLDLGKAIEWCYQYSPLETFLFHRLWR